MNRKRGGSKARAAEEAEALTLLKNRVRDFSGDASEVTEFSDLPLSDSTLKGLRSSHFVELTDVQKECIVPALQGKDLLVAARTGSGKTLGFLIPALERLYVEKWSHMDGLGVLIITPTRELASQIFEVLRKVGKYHQFSVGLLIGGNNIKEERDRVHRLNILVCTPGRLLQHMDESPGFDCYNLQMLILDEADRILDMGFRKTVDAIVANLPPQRQTLLFSATQTRSVSDLARLSLVTPEYISVHVSASEGSAATPETLEQFYTVVPVPEKLDVIWSFIRAHTKNKILVFFSSSKQVRFVYEAFRRLQPGIPLLHLHGRQKQTTRQEVTERFRRSRASCLFATDVVSRGIDFPEVEWVIQADCPEDVSTYIHRVGRSARAGKQGRALLLLAPREEAAFVSKITAKKIPIQRLSIREKKRGSVQADIQAQVFQDTELKYLAQKAFISYVRSVHVNPDKQVFDVDDIPLDEFAKSLGLASAPQIKIKGSGSSSKAHALKNLSRAVQERHEKKEPRTKYERMFERENQDVFSEHYRKLQNDEISDKVNDDDFMTVKRAGHDIDPDTPVITPEEEGPTSNRASKRALSKKASIKNQGNPTKLLFDDEGKPHALYEFQDEADFVRDGSAEAQRRAFVDTESHEMIQRDAEDKETVRAKRAEKKRKRKEAERLAREGRLSSDEVDDGSSDSEDEYQSEDDHSKFRSHVSKRAKMEEPEILEIEEPETLEDLEALSSRLLKN